VSVYYDSSEKNYGYMEENGRDRYTMVLGPRAMKSQEALHATILHEAAHTFWSSYGGWSDHGAHLRVSQWVVDTAHTRALMGLYRGDQTGLNDYGFWKGVADSERIWFGSHYGP
jgi:hypothetical protein